ncbi:Undecaprenyl-phosphate galactose phosphotransferase WbaP/exopolysaccharide biosynthesis polyprenyl glycosylphosphotransferase [Fonticella tunisiensis]|uniref:Undecaprenyl-phosphate galactose phosphotransferase WbaP/exopolysaccharide biosynthesis polyprenyl glycosylphosphotransferase n=2 Tax=Fonticella tunisiensis TaxID=1096341 RepID=A0A4R7KEK8_9CLOT|nr:Undecaprenyl-phosphate galactose phosphotransferase WbaP/exopolysaccharide biosynthesis polyprenyl glycosylphosphotransferase [Fonticella tunisiensis]
MLNQYEAQIPVGNKRIFYDICKRILDFISALAGIIILSPLFLIIMIVVKLDSPGPAIFGHKRLGKNGKIFKCYKFRSMYQNAEEMLKNLTPEQKKEFEENFKLKNDPRITKVGSFLRKTSLDELPQLFNILIGDMSVVGPRPIVEKELEKYGKYADKFLSVKPGLTGFWQANGRSETTYEERVQLDMYYIDNRSLWLDFKIICKTIIAVINKEGAM